MTSNVPLDYAVFQLSPRRSHCELFVSYDGNTEKLASGLFKPFVSHLKIAEEQVASAVESIKLEVDRCKNAEAWFTKGTLERFVRFVSTPEVLELVNTFDAEMSQLEAARKIYSQGVGDNQSKASGGDEAGATAASDVTKKELLRAIDVRLATVKQDLTTACNHALAAGFSPESVSELRHFADHFGAHRLCEACGKFIELSQKRPDLITTNNPTWKPSSDHTLRSSTSSDMSLDSPSGDHPKNNKVTFPLRRFSREPGPMEEPQVKKENTKVKDDDDKVKDKTVGPTTTCSTTEADCLTQPSQTPKLTRRLSVQERISLFESKQKENSQSNTTTTTPNSTTPNSTSSGGVKPDLRRLPSDAASEKAVLRRWSGASDMSIDVSGERKDPDSNSKTTPTPTSSSSSNHHVLPVKSEERVDFDKDKDSKGVSKLAVREKFKAQSADFSRSEKPISSDSDSKISSLSTKSAENKSLKEIIPPGSNQTSSGQTQVKPLPGETDDRRKYVEASDAREDVDEHDEVTGQPVTKPQFKSAASEFHSRAVIEDKERKKFDPFENQAETTPLQNSTSSRSKLPGHGPVSERTNKTGGGSDERSFGFIETEPVSSTLVEPMDQVQKTKQPKGNQELNDELKMKANELEMLFAEHKLRAPADQSNSARRTRPAEAPKEHVAEVSSPQLKIAGEVASGSSSMKVNSTPLMRYVDNDDFDVTPKHDIRSVGYSSDSRGKLYQRYMRKRDAKLREDWSVRRPEKEAKMKAMQDSLEKSRAEMMSKLAGSADKRNYTHDSGRRAEKMKSFNVRSTKKREQQIDSFMSDEDEDQSEYLRKKLSETFLGDSSTRSGVQSNKKILPNKNAPSYTPRNSALPAPRSSGKSSNSTAGRRRFNSDNPLAQSVPNFSDLKKENTKPSFVGSKPGRSHARNHAGRKNNNEDLKRIDVYEREENYEDYEKFPKHIEPKSLSKKGSIGSRSQASSMMEAVRNGHDLDDVDFDTEEMTTDAVKDEYDEFVDLDDNDKERPSLESDKSPLSGFENSDSFRLSQARPASVTELPPSMSSLFRSMGPTQDSPGESPGSWNPGARNPFSFPHEVSDIDSPMGSPASWNFHMAGSADAEAARMRKKWGAAQKPVVGTDSSHSRKDVTKGLKRFLKFGRKNRASESLADWVSATTSEGDDDTEDGRDMAYRSSEDLRKSRMGFSHSHYLDEGFNGTDLFNEQVAVQSTIPTAPSGFKLREEHLSGSSLKAPKSFFSLSNFRSKGNDSKLR